MRIFSPEQIRRIDRYTIDHEPVPSIALMERAAMSFYFHFDKRYPTEEVVVFAGCGNNGGDALALARMLYQDGRKINVYLVGSEEKLSADAKKNLDRLRLKAPSFIKIINNSIDLPTIDERKVIIDGLFGSGLNRSLEGVYLEVVQLINQSGAQVVSIDVPSGLFCNDNSSNNSEAIIKATHTISFQFPKLAFLLAENEDYVGKWFVIDIGLHQGGIDAEEFVFELLEAVSVAAMLKKRSKFAHKGHFGHALLLAGSYGKMGASVLASRGALKSGVGLLTAHVPHWGYNIIQCTVPEAMASIDRTEMLISEFPPLENYNAIGFGPGVGQKQNTAKALKELLLQTKDKSIVIDADGINILASDPELISLLGSHVILTPHPGECDRLLGKSSSSFERLQKARSFAMEHQVVFVLKGAYSVTISPYGHCYFNPTGNPGMATAGSGDVLTGIILSQLAQGHGSLEAAILGVYIHGLAGDLAKETSSYEGLTAGCIIDQIGSAFDTLRSALKYNLC